MERMGAIMSPSAAVQSETPKRAPNPFLSSVSASPLDQNPIDVAEINADAFNKCLNLVAEVREQRFTQALILMGEPGSGKTHLLSRLRATLEKESKEGLGSLFIPIRMVTNSRMLWRFLRRHLAVALLRQRSFSRVIRGSLDEISEQDRNLGIILGNLADGANYADSAAWFRGDELPEDVLKGLRLSGSGDEVEQEEASRRLLTMLCGLGEPIPFVFCFDQMEGLKSHTDDREGYFKMGQVLSELHDTTRNLVLLPCLQTSELPKFEAAIQQADRDRVKRKAGLQPLTLEQAMKLVDARVDNVPELKGQRPIREDDLKELFKTDGFCVARKVIVRCQELYYRWLQEPAKPVEPLEVVLETKYRNLQRTPRVEDAEGILRVALPSIFYLKDMKLGFPNTPNSVLEGTVRGKNPTATVICNQRAGLPLIKRLERVREDWRASGAPRLAILRDARNGVGVTAVKTLEAVAKIEREGARFLNVKPEALSALEAISRLLANARSGDLTYRGDSVPATSVETWLRSNMPRPVDELLDEIGGEKEPERDGLTGMLMDVLGKAKIVLVEDAAARLGKTAQEVEDCGRRNPSLVGFAGGSKRVLFRIVERQHAEQQRD
jgi:hypothetical protein